MRYSDFKLVESRGVTARGAGEVYVNVSDPDKTLAIQQIYVISPANTNTPNKPSLSTAYINQLKTEFEKNPDAANATVIINKSTFANLKDLTSAGIPMLSDMANKELASRNVAGAFETAEDMLAAVDENIPAGATKVEDNKSSFKTRAAIIAHTINQDSEDEWHVRYVEKIPPTGVHGLWKTFNGYQYAKSAKQENVPIKPADIILDDTPRTSVELAREVKNNVSKKLSGTKEEVLINPIHDAVDQALSGTTNPIQMPKEFVTVVAKYAGEYLGPISVASGKNTNGDIKKMLDVLNVPTLAGTRVVFPRSKSEELIDSIFILPNGTRLGVSTKMKQGSGAASSLSGVAKLLNEEIEQKYPTGSQIIKLLGRESAIDGPLQVAKMYDIIDDNDIDAFKKLNKNSRNILDLQSSRLQNLTKKQNTRDVNDPSYRVFFHTLTAITNEMVMRVNKNTEFTDTMLAALNNNNYLQLLTESKQSGQGVIFNYFGKFPIVFAGKPQLENKTYFSTGQKGRIGFKLK